jgi:hypothetical protein
MPLFVESAAAFNVPSPCRLRVAIVLYGRRDTLARDPQRSLLKDESIQFIV